LVVDERNGNEGGVVQNELGYGICGVVEKQWIVNIIGNDKTMKRFMKSNRIKKKEGK
jgi:hypothetical protein